MKQIVIEPQKLEEIKKEHLNYCKQRKNIKILDLSDEDYCNLFIENPFDKNGILKTIYQEKYSKYKFKNEYKYFRTPHKNSKSKWCAARLIEMLNINVCPYCGQQYFSIIEDKNKKIIAEANLDHYLPISKCQYLALNLYNLIPVCRCCNSTFKLDSDKQIVNPYHIALEDEIGFNLNNLSIINYFINNGIIDFEILNKNASQFVDNHIEVLRLKEKYVYYQSMIKTLIHKKQIFNQNYIQELKPYISIDIENLFIRQDLFNDNEPFLKFKRDIWEQLL